MLCIHKECSKCLLESNSKEKMMILMSCIYKVISISQFLLEFYLPPGATKIPYLQSFVALPFEFSTTRMTYLAALAAMLFTPRSAGVCFWDITRIFSLLGSEAEENNEEEKSKVRKVKPKGSRKPIQYYESDEPSELIASVLHEL